jgi:endonuclease/exonuclease/phosphatase family metal-dependent hydrolase
VKRTKPSFTRRFFGGIAFLLTLLAVIWLGCCVAASYISPLKEKYLALASITAPFAILSNFLLALFWLILAQRKWRAIVPIIALAASFPLVRSVYGLNLLSLNKMDPGPQRLKVMSWNVHGLGIFDRPVNSTTDDLIMAQIKKEAPDVLCLTEFYTIYNNALKPYSTALMQACGYREFRFKYDNTLGTKIYLGVAIFSRYPISGYKVYSLHSRSDGQDDVQLMQYDVHLPNGQIVRGYFTHLQSFLLSDGEKTYLEEVKHRDREIAVSESRSYVRRFGEAYVKRAIQADSAAKVIAKSPYPVILCGDFNDLPGSYTYNTMKRGLRDAFAEKGFGLGRTYNLFSPTLRIDYVFYDPKMLKIIGFRSRGTKLSDHNPVIANFEVKTP